MYRKTLFLPCWYYLRAYSNAIMDKVEEALKNGMVGNEDEDW